MSIECAGCGETHETHLPGCLLGEVQQLRARVVEYERHWEEMHAHPLCVKLRQRIAELEAAGRSMRAAQEAYRTYPMHDEEMERLWEENNEAERRFDALLNPHGETANPGINTTDPVT